MGFSSLEGFDANGKTVLVRADLNAPVREGVVQDSRRFQEAAETVKWLVKRGAKVVVLAHQGRPGDADFLSLSQHAVLLSKHVRKKVKFLDELFSERALAEVRKLGNGRVLLLENTRFYAEETLETAGGGGGKAFAETLFVKALAGVADAFVNEAFSVSHRAQASVVGFPELLPSYAGLCFEREFKAREKAMGVASGKGVVAGGREGSGEAGCKPVVWVLGGGKPVDCLKLLENAVASDSGVGKVLVGGVIGDLCLKAKGFSLGLKEEWLAKQGFPSLVERVSKALDKAGDKVVAPADLAFADADGVREEVPVEKAGSASGVVMDVGGRTAKAFADVVKSAGVVYFKGPLGAFEQPAFETGTRVVLKALESCKGFTLVGGGHSLDALEKFGVNKKKIGHVSSSGGALLAFLLGEELPGLKALERSSSLAGA